MRKKDLELVLKVLKKIKNPDTYVLEAMHHVQRDLLIYERRTGQLRDMADYEIPW